MTTLQPAEPIRFLCLTSVYAEEEGGRRVEKVAIVTIRKEDVT